MNKTEEELFHDQWAKTINISDLSIFQAFEGPVSPEYRFAIELLGSIKNKKILNPGCGAGEESIYLAKKGGNIWAADISNEMLKIVQKLAKKFKVLSVIKTCKENVERLNFPDNSFDLIFGNSILHHISLDKAIPEFYRVLKRKGKVVFIEPLGYNPVINYYRKLAYLVRTSNEYPLKINDILKFNKYFINVKHYEFHFLTLLIFCYFFAIEKINPNKDRYWKKIIKEGEKYKKIFNFLYNLDKLILKLFPFLKLFCWVTVIEGYKK